MYLKGILYDPPSYLGSLFNANLLKLCVLLSLDYLCDLLFCYVSV